MVERQPSKLDVAGSSPVSRSIFLFKELFPESVKEQKIFYNKKKIRLPGRDKSMADLLLIKVGNRAQNALKVQELLSRYGCNIEVRLGLHEFAPECEEKDEGIIILKLSGNLEDFKKLKEDLEKIEGVKAIYQEL